MSLPLLPTLFRIALWLPRFIAATHHFGLRATLRIFFNHRFGRDDGVTSVPLRALGRQFHFRSQSDFGVLCQFYEPAFRVLDVYGTRARVIIDAGANVGDSTARLRACHPEARIFAIEADPDNFELLQRNFAEDSQVTCLHRALWSSPGIVYVEKTWAHVASQVSEENRSGIPVKAITVPQLMEEYGLEEIGILKLDIEGAEAEVLRTSDREWLKKVRCLVFEVCDSDHAGMTLSLMKVIHDLGIQWQCHIVGECLAMVRSDTPWHVVTDLWLERRASVPPHIANAMATAGSPRLD
jgi:FkbM family methyltransferase